MPTDSARTILITGGNAGIGLATARALAEQGDRVIVTTRDAAKGMAAVAAVRATVPAATVEHRQLDLASLASIRETAAQLRDELGHLDVLINNAGIVQLHRSTTVDGFETTFGVNHLGHMLLVHELLPLVQAAEAGRIVVVASDAHGMAKRGLNFDDLQTTSDYKVMRVYGESKLANILYTRELARRLAGTGVTANSCHPGAVRTRLGRDGDGGRLGDWAMRLASPFFITPEKGARTSVFLATDPSVAEVSGEYFVKSRRAEPKPFATDDDAARRLWTASEQLLGLA